MTLLSLVMRIGNVLRGRNGSFSIITKAQTTLDIEGDNIKNIISPHKGGYILIKWNE